VTAAVNTAPGWERTERREPPRRIAATGRSTYRTF
jgi:hypothetical protein